MKNKNGSTIVEAAMVFPLAILLIAGIINVALTIHSEVAEDSRVHMSKVLSSENFEGLDLCFIMRGKQIFQ
ncbi:MAG: pilus assembly protein [Clostridia bacterium]|nr:pilus assembly protein [Clostridia bacterium]